MQLDNPFALFRGLPLMIVLVKKGEEIIIDSKKENPLHCVQYIPKSGVDIFQKLTK